LVYKDYSFKIQLQIFLAKTKNFSKNNLKSMPEEVIEAKVEAQNPLESIGETLANSLNKQANPLETPSNQMFVAEPFFKEEEKIEEKVEESVEVKAVEEEKKPETEVKTEEKPTETQIEAKAPEVDLVALLNESGVPVNSVDQIKSIIEENNNFKKAESEYRELTQEERARIEVGREFGDFGLYDRVLSIDTTKISHKEALKYEYFFDNLDSSPGFLEKTFEREFKKKYEEDPDEDYSKDALEENGRKALNKIIELQKDLKERGKISGGIDPEQAQREQEERDNKWFADVDAVLSKSDKISYELEDDSTKEKFAINIVMDGKDKQRIQDAMDRPLDYLSSKITDEKGNFDHEALYELIMRNEYFEKALDEARKSGAAVREESILKAKKHTVIESGKAGDPGNESKPIEQIAKSFQQMIHNNY
jgi:hypothetical protein